MNAQSPQWSPALEERYRIQRELGSGGMALVYLAEDRKHDRQVALKILKPEVAQSVGAERFLREIQLVAQLQHPHILPLYDSGDVDGALFYAMPYVEGQTLRQRLDEKGQLELKEALTIVREVGDALSFAHEQGIVHRDVKPENIMLYQGHATVMDFGIARASDEAVERLTDTGMSIGTPHYMSPEQVGGDAKIDARADMYALGCVLYEMLVGEPPFTGRTAAAVVARHLTDPVPSVRTVRGQVPLYVDDALTRALAKSPADRYTDVGRFVKALDTPVDARRIEARRKAPGIVKVAGLLLVAVGVGYGASVLGGGGGVGDSVSLAVFPFELRGEVEGNEHVAGGITEELIASLARMPGLSVTSRTASARAGRAYDFGRGEPLAAVAEPLGLEAVLTGRLEVRGDSLVVSPELMDPETEAIVEQLEPYRVGRSDLSAIADMQTEIARSIVAAYGIELDVEFTQTRAQLATDDSRARELYQQGRYRWSLRDPENVFRAQALFNEAVTFDPNYSEAWSGLADALVQIGSYSLQPPREVYPAARTAADHATRLSDGAASNGESLTSRGLISLFYDWDLLRAEEEFRRAIEADGGIQLAHMGLSLSLLAQGKYDEAEAAALLGHDVDRGWMPAAENYGRILYQTGKFDEAIEFLDRIVQAAPNSFRAAGYLGQALSARGDDHERAYEMLSAAHRLSGNNPLAKSGVARAALTLGREDEARGFLTELQTIEAAVARGRAAPLEYLPSYRIALIHLALGEEDAAFARFDRALSERESIMVLLMHDPDLRDYRDDPRFLDLAERVATAANQG